MFPITKNVAMCPFCNQEHEIQTATLLDTGVFKGKVVTYKASMQYCTVADEHFFTEKQLVDNYRAMEAAAKKLDEVQSDEA